MFGRGPAVADRFPWHPRALELFRQGYDVGSARLIAADEHRLQQASEQLVPVVVTERPSSPPARMVGAERQG